MFVFVKKPLEDVFSLAKFLWKSCIFSFFIPRNDSTLLSGYGPFCVDGTLLDIWEKDINECVEVFLFVTVCQNGIIFNFFTWKVGKA
jgi:hypothetical protein